jgi:hypothetical protein
MYALVALLLAEPASSDFVAAGMRFQDCVTAHAMRWAATNETIEVILDAATSACEREKFELQQAAIRAYSYMRPRVAMQYVDAVVEGTESGTRRAVTRSILDQRAQRAQPGVSQLPR